MISTKSLTATLSIIMSVFYTRTLFAQKTNLRKLIHFLTINLITRYLLNFRSILTQSKILFLTLLLSHSPGIFFIRYFFTVVQMNITISPRLHRQFLLAIFSHRRSQGSISSIRFSCWILFLLIPGLLANSQHKIAVKWV